MAESFRVMNNIYNDCDYKLINFINFRAVAKKDTENTKTDSCDTTSLFKIEIIKKHIKA
jgi:hypothetical protein